jgi:hypothetical protein
VGVVRGVPEPGAGRGGGAAAAGVHAPVPRLLHRHVAPFALHVSSVPGNGGAYQGGVFKRAGASGLTTSVLQVGVLCRGISGRVRIAVLGRRCIC